VSSPESKMRFCGYMGWGSRLFGYGAVEVVQLTFLGTASREKNKDWESRIETCSVTNNDIVLQDCRLIGCCFDLGKMIAPATASARGTGGGALAPAATMPRLDLRPPICQLQQAVSSSSERYQSTSEYQKPSTPTIHPELSDLEEYSPQWRTPNNNSNRRPAH
jgi:hypothetical protein